jgi:hypothetical protein
MTYRIVEARRRSEDRAEECRAFAEAARSQQARASYQKMAQAYEVLALDIERPEAARLKPVGAAP